MAERVSKQVNFMTSRVFAISLLVLPLFAKEEAPVQRLSDAATVFSEIMQAPDKSVPRDLLDKSYCIVIVPGLKTGAFIVGAKYGKGFISCRRKSGTGWSAPAAIRIEGGSVGFQIGASASDIVLLVMNDAGVKELLSSQYTLGGQADVAAGPVGRSSTAQTSGWMSAGILSWARTRGVFAGISLQGATLRQDLDDNQALYGRKLENKEIVSGNVRAPSGASKLLSLLNRYSHRRQK